MSMESLGYFIVQQLFKFFKEDYFANKNPVTGFIMVKKSKKGHFYP